jgi:hypothetical protein
MDDLVITGTAGLIGLSFLAVILLFLLYSVVRLMYSSLMTGNFGVVLYGIVGMVMVISLYLAIGFWLRKTDRI